MSRPLAPFSTIPFTAVLTFLTLILLNLPACAQQADSMLQFQLSDQLKKSAALWNKSDLEGFMEGYLHSDQLTFTSGGRVLRGFETLRERYLKRYGGSRQSMGQLSFSDVEVWKLAEGRALVLGRWKIDSVEAGATSTSDGIFTLVMVQVGQEWKIFHDHTSLSADR